MRSDSQRYVPRAPRSESWHAARNAAKIALAKIALGKKLIVFEGFSPNGYQIRNQREILHRIARLKIDFRHVFEKI